MKFSICLLAAAGLTCSLFAAPATAGEPVVGLIVKTESNPFFVRMKEAAREKAGELGVDLRIFAGKYDGDTATQAEAVENLVAAGAAGILIAPSDPAALAGAVGKSRGAGVLVIALDTPFDPADTVDITFATDNFRAGELIGRWARATMGDVADTAKYRDARRVRDSGPPWRSCATRASSRASASISRITRRCTTRRTRASLAMARRSARRKAGGAAMRKLLGETPGIDLVYAINEPAAAGAHAALKESGRDNNVLIVSIDGGCQGVWMVATGALGATAMQYPVRMAALGVEAAVEFTRTGRMPENTPGLDFHDTGVTPGPPTGRSPAFPPFPPNGR